MHRGICFGMLTAAVLALAVAASVCAQAPPPPGGPGPGPGMMPPDPARTSPACPVRLFMPPPPEAMMAIGRQLGLTEDQVAKGREMVVALRDKLQKMSAEDQANRNLVEAMKANPTDPNKVQALVSEAMKREEAMLKAELDMWMEFEKMLTPEQETKLWNMVLRARPAGPMPGGPPSPGAPPPPPPPPPGE